MAMFRTGLPQLDGGLYLTDAGIETDLIFNKGIEIREFAAHTLLPNEQGRQAIADYFRGFLELAAEIGAGFVLDSQTWKAHLHWADALQASEADLADAARERARRERCPSDAALSRPAAPSHHPAGRRSVRGTHRP